MEDKYRDFTEKRMVIFNEIVKRYWDGALKTPEDLNALAVEIKDKYGFDDTDMPFIQNHIRVAMGLDPKGDEAFNDELDRVKDPAGIKPPIVVKIGDTCSDCSKSSCECTMVEKYEHKLYKRNDPVIRNNKCISCGYCVSQCDFGALADKMEFIPLIDLLKENKAPVYAAVAPAIVGQFGEDVTMGKLRTALKALGFKDMVEVALFADILTIREALEFNNLVKTERDFFLTSCCCPVWFNMVKKSYPELYRHMSPSVSPMIASGRILKKLYKGAKVVFIAPCIAKKAEITEPDLKGSIDYVLNFRELKEIFKALGIHPEELPPDDKDQASFGGRIYARTGGVSFSVKTVVNRLEPTRVIKLKPKRVDGVKDCKMVLDQLVSGEKMDANFIEGMGCKGGCVGGPRTNIDAVEATRLVNKFGEDSFILTPFDNLNILKILEHFDIYAMKDIIHNEGFKKLLSRE